MSATRPRILDELGVELVRAARVEEASARRFGPRLSRALALALGAVLLVAAGAVAASLVIGRGEPIPPAPREQVPEELRPRPGTARLNGLAVPDPDGGPPWDIRTSRGVNGAVCITVGQVLGRELGIVGLDRRFRALPAGAADTCSTPQQRGATLAGARAFRGGDRLTAITVVNGVAAADTRTVVAVGGGRTQQLKLGPERAFLAIFRGTPEEVRPRIVLTAADATTTTLRFADIGEFLVPDPSGGTPWTVAPAGGNADRQCVQVRRQRGPDSPTPIPDGAGLGSFLPPSVPPLCGPRDQTFLDARRFVPERPVVGRSIWWGINDARTVVWGTAARPDSVVTLHAPGPTRGVAVDPRTRAFGVILDGRVDPRTVRLTVDGQPVSPRTRTAPAAWRSVTSIVKRHGVPNPFRPVTGTISIARSAPDPSGGPQWALRRWRAHPDPRVQSSRSQRDLRCFQIGRVGPRGTLLLDDFDGRPRPIAPTGQNVFCNGAPWLARHAAGAIIRVEVDDPTTSEPRPMRTVVAGLLGEHVRSAQLLGAGAPRPLPLGPDGTFLVVLDARAATGRFRVRQTHADGTTRTSRTDGLATPCRIQPGRTVRVADPDGGAPWVAGVSTVNGRSCSFTGREIAGRLAYLNPEDGTITFGPETHTSAPPGQRDRPRSAENGRITLTVRGPGAIGRLSATQATPRRAQIARRTLPGRTVVSGHATPDITSITIRTPRDIRTVKPVDGTFLAVYDGAFYTGEIIATGHRPNGNDVLARQPVTYP
jgi:hypothetical protein